MDRLFALIAGLAGALVMLACLALAHAAGAPLAFDRLLYALRPRAAWTAVILLFLLGYAVLGLVYDAAFRRLPFPLGVRAGLFFAGLNALAAIVLLLALPVPSPGSVFSVLAFEGSLVFVLAHFAYGAVVSTLLARWYRPRAPLGTFWGAPLPGGVS